MAGSNLPETHAGTDHVVASGNDINGSLSQHLFSSPTDFLTTLKQAVQNAKPENSYDISQEDLLSFASSNANPKQHAAETIAATHFEQLRELSYFDDGTDNKLLSLGAITDDINLASGNTKPLIDERVQKLQNNIVAYLALAGTFGATALATAAVPVVPEAAVTFAGLTLIGAATSEALALGMPGSVSTKASNDQKILASWPEINR